MGLEFVWRGRSHYSMFLTGGVCFLLLGAISRRAERLLLPVRVLAGAGIITAAELIAGLLFNRDYSVWDYRHMPMNFLGQICLLYSLLWIPVSFLAMDLYGRLEGLLKGIHKKSPAD